METWVPDIGGTDDVEPCRRSSTSTILNAASIVRKRTRELRSTS